MPGRLGEQPRRDAHLDVLREEHDAHAALALPTRWALRTRPIEAIGVGE